MNIVKQNENGQIELKDDAGKAIAVSAARVTARQKSGAVTFVSRKALGEITGRKGAELKRLHAQLVNGQGKLGASAQVAEINQEGLVLVKRAERTLKDGRKRLAVTFESPVETSAAKRTAPGKSPEEVEQEAMAKALNVLAEKLGMDVATVQQLTNGEAEAAA